MSVLWTHLLLSDMLIELRIDYFRIPLSLLISIKISPGNELPGFCLSTSHTTFSVLVGRT